MRRPFAVGAAVLILAGCAAPAPTAQPTRAPVAGSSPAVWTLASEFASGIAPGSTSIEIAASRLECSSGVTGELFPPTISYEPERVLVKVTDAPLPDGAYECPSNDLVSVTVTLTEPLGDRDLVDETCLSEPAMSTSFCEDNGIRWSPGAG
jgi:hypothetical protein